MTTFEHAGVEITMGQDATFTATVAGKHVRKQSLKAMKDFIDRKKEEAFVPFSALVRPTWSEKANIKGVDLCRVKVVGKEKLRANQRSYGALKTHEFILERGRPVSEVMDDTEENLQRFKAAMAYKEETKRINDERDVEQDRLDNAVTWIYATEQQDRPKRRIRL